MLAVAQSLLGLVYRSSRVDVEVLGKIHGEKAAWGGIRNHPDRTTVPGVLVLRVDSSLFWVNAAQVRDAILEAVDTASETDAPKALVLDLESTDQLETTSADMLSALRHELAERGVDLYLVRVRWPVRRLLARCGLREALGEDHLWHNVAQGVREARRQHQLGGHHHPEPEPPDAAEELIVAPTPLDENPANAEE
jgi:MFS superfamily sulfate permease-like transporter